MVNNNKRITRAPDSDDVPPPSRPPLRTPTPVLMMVVDGNGSGDDGENGGIGENGEHECSHSLASSTIATEDIPEPPPLRSKEQAPPIAGTSSHFPGRFRNSNDHHHDGDRTSPVNADSRHQPPPPPPGQSHLPQSDQGLTIPNSTTTTARMTDGDMSDDQFLVKTYMAALGSQENTNSPRIKPGAVSVHGVRSSVAQVVYDNVGDSTTSNYMGSHHDAEDPLPLAAHLSPDEADVTARLAERIERQITETIEERLKEQLQTQFSQHQQQPLVASYHSQDYPPPVLAEILGPSSSSPERAGTMKSALVEDDNFKVCGLRRRTWGVVLALGFLVGAGAIVGVLLYLRRHEETTKSPSTVMPTAAPTSNPRVVDLRNELFPILVPADAVSQPFADPTSPQSMAWNWIENDSISLSVSTPIDHVVKRYALAVLYFATNGPTWSRNNFGYLSPAEVCDWNNGLEPLQDNLAIGVFCGLDSGLFILLINNGLQGVIPWELSLLSDLQVIGLDQNSLRGGIPSELSNLSQLYIFWASSNLLTGSLPTTLGANMQSIDLTNNQVSGTMPESWADTMPRLFSIGLGFNQLTGSLPSGWTNLASLEQLDVGSNRLIGSIPNYGPFWLQLKSLFLDHNRLSGPLPTSVAQMTALENLVVYNNTLTGSIPSELGLLTNLVYLSLAANDFEGSLNVTLCQTLPALTAIETDCLEDSRTGELQVQCSCCSTCCSDEGFCELYND